MHRKLLRAAGALVLAVGKLLTGSRYVPLRLATKERGLESHFGNYNLQYKTHWLKALK